MGQQLKIPFIDGMKVGLGYDLLTGQPMSSPSITFAGPTPPQTGLGQTVTTTFRLIQDVDALHDALGISASVAGGYAGFSGSAKMQFAQECSVTQYCLYAVLAVEVINSCVTVDGPVLVQDGTDLLTTNDMPRFRQRFGNRYISGLKTGGEYYAVYRVQSFDAEERVSISAKIAASFHNPVLSASLNADIESSKATSQNELDVNVFVYEAGGITTTETDLAQMIDKAHAFPTLVAGDRAISYQVLLDEYIGLELPGDNLNFYDQEKQTETLLFNTRLLNDFNSLINDIDFIRQHMDRFHNPDGSPPDDQALQDARTSCVTIVGQLESAISGCMKDATTCSHFLQTTDDFTNKLPILRSPKPGMVTITNLVGSKAVIYSDALHFVKNQDLVNILLTEGLYYVIDNPDALEFHLLGSAFKPDAGTIVTQSPLGNQSVPEGTIVHATVSPVQDNPGPTS